MKRPSSAMGVPGFISRRKVVLGTSAHATKHNLPQW